MSSSIIHINSDEYFKKILNEHDKIIVKFATTWCGPCRIIAPFYGEIANSQKYKPIKFVEVDAEQLPEITKLYNIASVPAFVALYHGKKIDSFVGSNKKSIIDLTNNLNQIE